MNVRIKIDHKATLKIQNVSIIFRYLQVNQIMALNNPWRVSKQLNK